MITSEQAKHIMNSGKSIFYKDIEYLCINALIFKKGFSRYDVSAELLDKNRKSVIIVPIEFLELEKVGEKAETQSDTFLKEISENSKDLMIQFYNCLDSGKLEDSQNKLHEFLEILLTIENTLTKELQVIEKEEN